MPGLGGGFTLGDLLTLVGTLIGSAFYIGRALLKIRDTVRDLKLTLGSVQPRAGLLGQIAEVEETVEAIKVQQQAHREWMIHHEDRRHADQGLTARRGLVVRKSSGQGG